MSGPANDTPEGAVAEAQGELTLAEIDAHCPDQTSSSAALPGPPPGQLRGQPPGHVGPRPGAELQRRADAWQVQELVPVTEETDMSFSSAAGRYVLKELLGEGSFGGVYRCSFEPPGGGGSAGSQGSRAEGGSEPADFAVKVIDARRLAMLLGHPEEVLLPRLRREVEILLYLGASHPGILRLHVANFSPASRKFYLVTELLRGGDLFHAIVSQGRPYSESQGRKIFAQIADAVAFCHSKGVAHRDLKLENCLFREKGSLEIKVCDYGQAKLLRSYGISDTARTLTTSPQYTAPEVASAVESRNAYDAFKADAFGLGVMLYALLCSALPDAARGQAYARHRQWPKLSEDARNLISLLLHPDPSQRPLPKDIKEHPWLTNGRQPSPLNQTAPPADACPSPVATLLQVQYLIIALQRERGMLCWALGDSAVKSKLHWHMKGSSECLQTASNHVMKIIASGAHIEHTWSPLSNLIRSISEELPAAREKVTVRIRKREDDIDIHGGIRDIFGFYCGFVDRSVDALHNVLTVLRDSIGSGMSTSLLRIRLLQLVAEQLARERGFIAGHLAKPESLRDPAVARELAEITGARKMLTGSTSGQRTLIGAGRCLLSTLDLMDVQVLHDADLAALEQAEDGVLGNMKLDLPAVAEWWRQLSEAHEKVHRHIILNIGGLARQGS